MSWTRTGLITLVLLLTACQSAVPSVESGSPPAAESASTPQAPVTPAEDRPLQPVWESEGGLLSHLGTAGNRVLAMARGASEDRMDLVALESATGREVWRKPWSPNGGAGLNVFGLVQAGPDHYVVFVVDDGQTRSKDGHTPWQNVISVRVSDGDTRIVLERAFIPDRPSSCAVDSDRICFGAALEGSDWYWVEWSPASGDRTLRPSPWPLRALTAGYANTLADSGLPDPNEQFARMRDGKVAWMIDSRKTFGARISEATLHTSGADKPILVSAREGKSEDLGERRFVALDPETGKVLWRRDGVFDCGPTIDRPSGEPKTWVSMCEGSGIIGAADARLTLAQIEIGTGRTLRSHQIDPVPGNLDSRDVGPWLPDGFTYAVIEGREQQLDTRSGTRTELRRERLLCGENVRKPHALLSGALPIGGRLQPCIGDSADRTLPVNLLDSGEPDGFVAVVRDGRMYAYRR